MKTRSILPTAAAAALLLAACASTPKEEPTFQQKVWDGAKQTTDQLSKESVDTMKKTSEKTDGFFQNLWK